VLKPRSLPRPWDLHKREVPPRPMENRCRDPFYHTTRWKKESRLFRQMNPLCAECEKEGLVVPGEVTDHIIPKEICGDPWDKSNWQSLCKKHHSRKAAEDRKQIRKKRNIK